MAPLSHSQEVQIQWGKLSIAVHRRSSQVARRLQQLNSSGFRSFPCFDLLRVYAEFFWVWHFLFVFFLFPTALPTAMLMPVSFCTVCALLVVSNMWGVCFAVFVQWETLCFVSVLHFPLVAVKVLWRFPLCKGDLWASSSSRETEGKSDVIFSCAYFCFGVWTARLYLQLTRILATYMDIRDTAMWQRQEASLLMVRAGMLLLNPCWAVCLYCMASSHQAGCRNVQCSS